MKDFLFISLLVIGAFVIVFSFNMIFSPTFRAFVNGSF